LRWLRHCCITLLALTFYFQASPLHAIELYYVELGRFPNESKATQNWQQLLDDQTSLLDELEPYPRPVIHEGRQVLFHLYAGPLEGKQEATKLCQRLFAADIACFVVEGLPAAPQRRQAQSDKDLGLPWLSEAKEKAQQQEREQALLPWTVARPDRHEKDLQTVVVSEAPRIATEETSAKLDQTAQIAAKMQVAEAVRVPLSQQPEMMVSQKPIAASQADFALVTPFATQRDAVRFWQRLAAYRRVDIRAEVSRSADKMSYQVRVNLTSNPAMFDALCLDVTQLDAALSCIPDSADVSIEPHQLAADKSEAASEGEVFRVRIMPPFGDGSGAPGWHRLVLEQHADLLSGLKQASEPQQRHGKSAMLVGEFASKDEALALCYQLKQRQLSCQIIGGI